jgi:hypothetical protein
MACYALEPVASNRHTYRDSRGRFARVPVPTVEDLKRDILSLNTRDFLSLVRVEIRQREYQVISGFRRMEAARFITQGLDDIESYASKANA